MISLYGVIPAGGAGTRLIPATSASRPKPLLPIPDPQGPSLLRQTASRFDGIVPPERRVVVASEALIAMFRHHLPEGAIDHWLTEPAAKNTGPALVLAATWAQQQHDEAVVVNTPADHWVADPSGWRQSVARAAELAVRGYLVLLGVALDEPDSGYGYIVPGGTLHAFGRKVHGFREKPPLPKAAQLLADGALANAGVFVWTAKVFLRAVSEIRPAWLAAAEAALSGDVEPFLAVESGSIDREILEKIPERLAVLSLDSDWDDIGTWPRLYQRMCALDLAGDDQPFVWNPDHAPVPPDLDADEAFVSGEGRIWRFGKAALDRFAAKAADDLAAGTGSG